MKFNYIVGTAIMALSEAKLNNNYMNKRALAMKNLLAGKKLQEEYEVCEVDFEEFFECLEPAIAEEEKILSGFSEEQQQQANEIMEDFTLTNEQTGEALEELLGDDVFCTPEFLEVLPRQLLCFFTCDKDFCEENEQLLKLAVEELGVFYGCEVEADDVCDDFADLVGAAGDLDSVSIVGVIVRQVIVRIVYMCMRIQLEKSFKMI
eukprot:snap_masked-scaffold_22-processed-gene-1.0-mRNA-1 protein AED:1.00 eAED:1.00 QI:0/0/0/0/1/1/2/0/205